MPLPHRLIVAILPGLLVCACAGSDLNQGPTSDDGSDAGREVGVPDADAGGLEDVPPDADVPDEDLGPLLEPEILRRGNGGLLLRGIVLGPDRTMIPGEVIIVGDGIMCVDTDCSADPAAADATVVETHGIISPGLIDAHNHLPYNFLPEWIPPEGKTYSNRYEWSDEPSYEAHIAPYANHRSSGSHYCPAARWGELRSLLHGTTTIQGQSFAQNCIEGGARNADHKHAIHYDHMRTTIASPRDITTDDAQNFLDSFQDPVDPTTRFAVHMGEGVTGANVEEEFSSFAGRDPRPNRHNGTSLLYDGTSILIHSIAVTDEELVEVRDTDSKIVWSPSSNLALYGVTADIERILELGITTGLGPDWTLSGEDNMLAEMAFADDYGAEAGIADLTPRKIWQMATSEGAEVVGLADHIGRLEAGYRADIVVISARMSDDPMRTLLESNADDIALVLVGGEAYFGAAALAEDLGRNDFCETFDACGRETFVCAKDPAVSGGDKNVDETRNELVDILEGNGFPPEEQYGRGDELLPLVSCD